MVKSKYLDVIYLLILGITIGAVLVLGIMVAPVVFGSEHYLTTPWLSRFEEGKLMAEVFSRFGYLGYITVLMVLFYEIAKYKYMLIDKISMLSAIGVVATILMFVAVYTPKILEYQALGESAIDESFEAIHRASELDFKIMLVMLLVLFARRAYLIASER